MLKLTLYHFPVNKINNNILIVILLSFQKQPV